MSNMIQIRRGLEADLPTLGAGEFGFSTDTYQLRIGDGVNNHELMKRQLFDAEISTETKTVDSFADTLGDGAMWFYIIKKGAAVRAGVVIAAWEAAGDSVEYMENSTLDIGDTSDLTLLVDISSDTVRLRSIAASDNWIVKVQRLALYACS